MLLFASTRYRPICRRHSAVMLNTHETAVNYRSNEEQSARVITPLADPGRSHALMCWKHYIFILFHQTMVAKKTQTHTHVYSHMQIYKYIRTHTNNIYSTHIRTSTWRQLNCMHDMADTLLHALLHWPHVGITGITSLFNRNVPVLRINIIRFKNPSYLQESFLAMHLWAISDSYML